MRILGKLIAKWFASPIKLGKNKAARQIYVQPDPIMQAVDCWLIR
jgi:hypothetical protein